MRTLETTESHKFEITGEFSILMHSRSQLWKKGHPIFVLFQSNRYMCVADRFQLAIFRLPLLLRFAEQDIGAPKPIIMLVKERVMLDEIRKRKNSRELKYLFSLTDLRTRNGLYHRSIYFRPGPIIKAYWLARNQEKESLLSRARRKNINIIGRFRMTRG